MLNVQMTMFRGTASPSQVASVCLFSRTGIEFSVPTGDSISAQYMIGGAEQCWLRFELSTEGNLVDGGGKEVALASRRDARANSSKLLRDTLASTRACASNLPHLLSSIHSGISFSKIFLAQGR